VELNATLTGSANVVSTFPGAALRLPPAIECHASGVTRQPPLFTVGGISGAKYFTRRQKNTLTAPVTGDIVRNSNNTRESWD